MEPYMEKKGMKKMKILCLHGFRTSGKFLQKQLSKWDASIFPSHLFHLEFADGLFPAGGPSEIEGIFPPPYFEWFQFNKDFTEYTNLEECISYLCEYITTKGPFDGFLGFSQGATLSALLLGYQMQGKVLKEHPPIKLFVSISGSKFRDPSICDIAYKDLINVRSVHFVGAKDWLRLPSEELATAFHNPLIIRHPQGHTVPRLDEDATDKLRSWTKEILLFYGSSLQEAASHDDDKQHYKEEKVDDPKWHEAATDTMIPVAENGDSMGKRVPAGEVGPTQACIPELLEEPITLQQDLEIALQVEKLAEIALQQATAHILADGKFRSSAA